MQQVKQIIHLDMDAFYASVEVLDNPQLKGKPVIVGGSRARGVVSSASYEARKFGVHSAQPIATAMRLCPQGIFLPVRMDRYHQESERIIGIFHRFTPLVEPLSLDEAFLDVTGSTRLFGSAEEIARRIKQLVKEETGLTVSAGVAPLKFVAKIASDLHKPDGLTIVPPDQVKQFLAPLLIEKLWGIGPATHTILKHLGVHTIGDLSRIPLGILEAKLGKHGTHLHLLSQGIDDRGVMTERDAKSIGAEETFSEDLHSLEEARRELLSLSLRVTRRLRQSGLVCSALTLKVKYHDFKQITRSVTIPDLTRDHRTVFHHCCALLQKTDAGEKPIRLLGISLSQLAMEARVRQRSLLSEEFGSCKDRNLHGALDHILDRFGEGAIMPGTLLKK